MWLLLAVSCLLIASSLFANGVNQADDTDVRRVIADFAGAKDHHDGKAMAALHTEDVNFVNIFCEWWKSRIEVEKILTRIHSEGGGIAHSTMKIKIEQVKFPASTVAVVHGIVELFNAPPPTLGENHFIRILVKQHSKWLISSFQNTRIAPPPPAH
jgi:uncharacterized protein (TIGR02246 family)